jgi:hypothetical protein
VPRIGDMILVWQELTGPDPGLVVSPGVVLDTENPDDPQTPIVVTVFDWCGVLALDNVPYSAEPRVGCWCWRPGGG